MKEGAYYICAVCGMLHPVGFSHDEWIEETKEKEDGEIKK